MPRPPENPANAIYPLIIDLEPTNWWERMNSIIQQIKTGPAPFMAGPCYVTWLVIEERLKSNPQEKSKINRVLTEQLAPTWRRALLASEWLGIAHHMADYVLEDPDDDQVTKILVAGAAKLDESLASLSPDFLNSPPPRNYAQQEACSSFSSIPHEIQGIITKCEIRDLTQPAQSWCETLNNYFKYIQGLNFSKLDPDLVEALYQTAKSHEKMLDPEIYSSLERNYKAWRTAKAQSVPSKTYLS